MINVQYFCVAVTVCELNGWNVLGGRLLEFCGRLLSD